MPVRRHTHTSAASTAVGHVALALDAFCAAERLPEHVAWRLRVALDEIVSNIVAYGARRGEPPALDVWFGHQSGMVEITVADDGPPFDPLTHPAPDVALSLDVRQPGGLGIALIRSLMDEVQYERTSRNVLTIRKRIEAAPSGGEGADGDPTEHP